MKNFKFPFSISLLTLEPEYIEDSFNGSLEPRSFVHFVCTHAFSDGFTSFPIINDFAELYEAELLKKTTGEIVEVSGQPPSAFEELQRRLYDALEVQPME